jgi:hypothetical protein
MGGALNRFSPRSFEKGCRTIKHLDYGSVGKELVSSLFAMDLDSSSSVVVWNTEYVRLRYYRLDYLSYLSK